MTYLDYPHSTIWVNRRTCLLQDIISGVEQGDDSFEKTLFSFIKLWFADSNQFELQTSGSTGAPKTIAASRGQLIVSAKMTADALGLNNTHTAFLCLDTQYIAGKMMVVRSFVTGMKLFACTPSANIFHQLPPTIRIDFTAIVPNQLFETLNSNEHNRFNKVKVALVGGAPLSNNVCENIQQYNCHFYATYGMTETLSHIALQLLNGNDASDYYTCLPGIDISIDDRRCLVIKAPHLSQQIVTNDIVELKGNNTFKWLGRYDNLINSGGVKLNPEALENKVAQTFGLLHITYPFIIAALPDKKLGNKVVLLIEGPELDKDQLQTLKTYLKKVMSTYEYPRSILFTPSFVCTTNGKINRTKTSEIFIKDKD